MGLSLSTHARRSLDYVLRYLQRGPVDHHLDQIAVDLISKHYFEFGYSSQARMRDDLRDYPPVPLLRALLHLSDGIPIIPPNTTPASLIFSVNPDTSAFQTDGGAPSTLTNDPVVSLLDDSGNGLNFLTDPGIGGFPPTFVAADQNGKGTIAFNGTNQWLTAGLVMHGINDAAFWYICAVRVGPSVSFGTLFSVGVGSPGFYIDALKPSIYFGIPLFFNTALIAGSFHILEFIRSNGTVRAFVDGVEDTSVPVLAGGVANDILTLGFDYGGSWGNHHMGRSAFYKGIPPDSQRIALLNEYGSYYGVPVTP